MPFFMLRSTLKAYPDAKFLLTERDPEKWAKSFLNTAGAAATNLRRFPMPIFKHFDGFAFHMANFGNEMVDYCTNGFGASDKGREALVENYKTYIADVKRLVPPEQLKVCRLEDGFGWKEVCPYLGIPIPNTPWPSLNTPEEFNSIVGPKFRAAFAKGLASVTTIVAVAATGIWYARKSFFPLLA
ncbi:putative NAD dependent epimerase protein [Rosellinia necatrix]|uniref:Putative NAD dependent epimerase protein n=1 Tax=Rosellinia necatrix TaxID=77044 RepID=A0A1S8A7G1_ROSNE|nr:putative NAD dependent epimerase protein [Rosellinia necatrix]